MLGLKSDLREELQFKVDKAIVKHKARATCG
jgi:hypothetical protein